MFVRCRHDGQPPCCEYNVSGRRGGQIFWYFSLFCIFYDKSNVHSSTLKVSVFFFGSLVKLNTLKIFSFSPQFFFLCLYRHQQFTARSAGVRSSVLWSAVCFLSSYLHSCSPPIIHGNLTCDTIFIQHNGLVKIGSGNHIDQKKIYISLMKIQ